MNFIIISNNGLDNFANEFVKSKKHHPPHDHCKLGLREMSKYRKVTRYIGRARGTNVNLFEISLKTK